MKNPQFAQTGFAAIAAIFLVLILAALGAFMVGFSNTQQLNSAQDVQGSRAYWAARAGLEWAVVAIPATPALCPNTTLTVVGGSAPATIEGFTLEVRCAKNAYIEGATTRTILSIQSTARLGSTAGSIAFIERSVSASLEL
jgi:MSHA biogenesis protein MshP